MEKCPGRHHQDAMVIVQCGGRNVLKKSLPSSALVGITTMRWSQSNPGACWWGNSIISIEYNIPAAANPVLGFTNAAQRVT
eukprot:1159778-Pelagomonas_calceolata.AAC.14